MCVFAYTWWQFEPKSIITNLCHNYFIILNHVWQSALFALVCESVSVHDVFYGQKYQTRQFNTIPILTRLYIKFVLFVPYFWSTSTPLCYDLIKSGIICMHWYIHQPKIICFWAKYLIFRNICVTICHNCLQTFGFWGVFLAFW